MFDDYIYCMIRLFTFYALCLLCIIRGGVVCDPHFEVISDDIKII